MGVPGVSFAHMQGPKLHCCGRGNVVARAAGLIRWSHGAPRQDWSRRQCTTPCCCACQRQCWDLASTTWRSPSAVGAVYWLPQSHARSCGMLRITEAVLTTANLAHREPKPRRVLESQYQAVMTLRRRQAQLKVERTFPPVIRLIRHFFGGCTMHLMVAVDFGVQQQVRCCACCGVGEWVSPLICVCVCVCVCVVRAWYRRAIHVLYRPMRLV